MTAAEVKDTQFGPIALFDSSEGKLSSFNKAIVADATAIVAKKISLPKTVKVVNAKSKTGKTYLAFEEA